MRLRTRVVVFSSFAATLLLALAARAQDATKGTWSFKADYIEACSCHLFCTCYFNTSPEGGRCCEFNMAIKIEEAHLGDVKVDKGAKLWLSGDLGGDWSSGNMKSLVVTFDPAVPAAQREALKTILGKIYPAKWGNVAADEAAVTWELKGQDAYAKLGDAGEITLTAAKDENGKQTVIQNLKYWGAKTNTGFYLANSAHHYKGHGHDYTYKKNNGFTIHVESDGKLEESKK